MSINSSSSDDHKVISPFAESNSAPVPTRSGKNNTLFYGILFAIALLILGGGAFLLYTHLNDPFRTLEPFPVEKYLDGYKALQGACFKGDLVVENDLGFKDGFGRLMVFSTKESTHPLVVMIPASLAATGKNPKPPIYLIAVQTRCTSSCSSSA